MKGAIGNAFILNMVITFIIIFYMLLIGSMAYSKSYKINNFILDSVVFYAESSSNSLNESYFQNASSSFNVRVNDYLSRVGYTISSSSDSCPIDNNGYQIIRNTVIGGYEYCVYSKDYSDSSSVKTIYKVLSYMRFDFPVVGQFLKLPLSRESKVIVNFH